MPKAIREAATIERIRWGVWRGTWFTALGIVWSLTAYFINGRAKFEARTGTMTQAILSYVLMGPLGGAVVGAMLPLTRAPLGGLVVGVTASLPIAVVLSATSEGALFSAAHLVTDALVIALGAMLGLAYGGRSPSNK